MLTLSNVGKSYGGRVLFEKVSLQLNREERVGLVGPNGAGKSTLLKMVLSQVEPDSGTIQFQRGSVLGYLPQEMARGADGAMTGFAYPEMLVTVVNLYGEGKTDQAQDLFDAYLPVIRYEQQPGFGLAVRKEVLRRRGAIANASTRAPGPKLSALDHDELSGLLARLEIKLKEIA